MTTQREQVIQDKARNPGSARTVKRTAIYAAVLAQSIFLAACGGGGGGGPSATLPTVPSPPPPGIPTVPTPPQPPSPPPLPAQYSVSPLQQMTGFQLAHQAGHRGAGITVAVVDSGFDAAQFAGEFGARLLPGFNAATGQPGVTTDVATSRHGTNMARIIAGSGVWAGDPGRVTMAGFAPDANIFPVLASDHNSGSITHSAQAFAHLATLPDVRVVNMSFSTGNQTLTQIQRDAMKASMMPLRNAGKLMVAGSGNSAAFGIAAPGFPAQLAADPDLASHMLVAGSVQSSRLMASYSQPAGMTMHRYLVAPGFVNLGTESAPAYSSGTSNAAAMVSGAAAVVWGRWTYLTADRVANVLLETAEDMGDPGTDPVFGRGLLRLDRAMEPHGALIAQSMAGQAMPLGSPVGALSPAQMAALSSVPVQFYDRLDRHFTLPATSLFQSAAPASAEQRRDAALQEATPQHEVSQGGYSFAFAGSAGRAEPWMRMGFANDRASGSVWSGAMFAPMNLVDNPAVGRLRQATGADTSLSLGGGVQAHAQWAGGTLFNGRDLHMGTVGASLTQGAWRLQALVGSGAADSQGAAGDVRNTVMLNMQYALDAGSSVSLAYHMGRQNQALGAGLGFADASSDAVVLRWTQADFGVKGARLVAGLTLAQAQDVSMSLGLPTGVNMETGAATFEQVNIVTRQRIPARLDLAWSAPVRKDAQFQFGASASSASDAALSVRFSQRF